MSADQTHQTFFYEGVRAYEAGKIHEALSRWKQVLNTVPNHSGATRYIRFVENFFNINVASSEQEVTQAVFKMGILSAAPAPVASEVSNLNVAERNSFQYSRQPLGEVSVEMGPSTLSVIPDSLGYQPAVPQSLLNEIQEMKAKFDHNAQVQQVVVTPPAPVKTQNFPSISTPSPLNPVAQQALSGNAGPSTQADGLTIQALIKKISELHRNGKYDQAVEVARELLAIDPTHLVAQRYITEYQRQKQLALDTQRKKQTQSYQQVDFKSVQEINEDVPTATPPAVKPPEAEDVLNRASSAAISSARSLTVPPANIDLSKAPKILLSPEMISWQELDHRAGFFLSQVDGTTSYEDLIEISGMPKNEALMILAKLLEKGVIGTR